MFGGDTLAGFRDRLGAVLTGDLRLDSSLCRRLAAEAESVVRRGGADALPELLALLSEWDIDAQWSVVLRNERPQAIAEWVEPYVRGVVLQLACGDGALGERLADLGTPVLLAEREQACFADRRHTVPFTTFRGTADGLPACDTVLFYGALRREADPAALLAIAAQTAARRIVLVESVVDAGCPAELHRLMGLFFHRCLGDATAAGDDGLRTDHEWISLAAGLGRLAAIEMRARVPGVPLPHVLIAVDLDRREPARR